MPLFKGGQLNAVVDMAHANRDQAFITYRKTIMVALEEIENASVSLNQNRIKYSKTQRAVQFSRKATYLSRTLYQGGSTSLLELLNTERLLYSSEISLLQLKVNLLKDYIRLQIALGGGWNGTISSDRPEVQDGYTGPHLIAKGLVPAAD